jgi:MtN3 and saliva related transmembrane protein
MNDLYLSLFGWLAAFITCTYKIPQIVKLIKVKRQEGLSISSLIIQTIGYLLYMIHGFLIKDMPILYIGLISFFENLVIIFLYHYYKKNTIIYDTG